MPQAPSDRVPKAMQSVYEAVTKLTDEFCATYLDDEYAVLCRKAVAALARKRPSPLLKGSLEGWVCGVIHAVGSTNFLFDKTQTPHIRADELAEIWGVSKSTAHKRASEIQKWLRMGQFTAEWCLPGRMDDNLALWLVEVDGFIVDIRLMPRELQQRALELCLIPYVPDDQPE